MNYQYKPKRLPNRLHMAARLLNRLLDLGWFSLDEYVLLLYLGRPRPFRQQRKRVRELLLDYAEQGRLESTQDADGLWWFRCPENTRYGLPTGTRVSRLSPADKALLRQWDVCRKLPRRDEPCYPQLVPQRDQVRDGEAE